MVFTISLALAIRWKNIVFLCPYFNQVALDFCLHFTSSLLSNSQSLDIRLCFSLVSSSIRSLCSSILSQSPSKSGMWSFSSIKPSISSLYHSLILAFKNFNFFCRLKLAHPSISNEHLQFSSPHVHTVSHDSSGSSSLIRGDQDDFIRMPHHEYNAYLQEMSQQHSTFSSLIASLAQSGTSSSTALHGPSPYRPRVIDSRATNHMMGKSEFFSSFDHSKLGHVRLANGSFITIFGKGFVPLFSSISLPSTLLVPNSFSNLVC